VTRWLVDGMNVIGSKPDGWWRDRPAAMKRLVSELESLDGDVMVVFDGKPVDIETGRVKVAFASRRGPNAADDDIATLAAGDPDPATLTVVTSDGELERRVRASGANVEGAGAFRRRLDGG
jgi:predicted RNA-binding protein with PIN domain